MSWTFSVFHFMSQPALLNPARLTCHISWVLTEKAWRCSPNSATAVIRILWTQTQLMFIRSSHIDECFHLLMIPLYSFNSWGFFVFLICLFVYVLICTWPHFLQVFCLYSSLDLCVISDWGLNSDSSASQLFILLSCLTNLLSTPDPV